MRKALSFVLLAVLLSSNLLPAFAQNPNSIKPDRSRAAKGDETKFATIQASAVGGGVQIEWSMEVETNNIGFVVYRKGKGGAAERVSKSRMVMSPSMRVGGDPYYGETYSFYDRSGIAGTSYYVESINLSGKRIVSPTVTAAFTSGLKSIAGISSAALAAADEFSWKVEQRRLSPPRELSSAIKAGRHIPDPATHATVVSQAGVKIGVKKEGFYRVTSDELAAGGFDIGTDPNSWQLYLEGVEQAIIVGPGGSYIEFLGNGTDTPETDVRKYFLTVGSSPGKRITTRAAVPNETTTTSPGYLQSFIYKERKYFLDTVVNGEGENYWGEWVMKGQNITVPITLSGIDVSGPNIVFELKLQGFSNNSHIVSVKLNGTPLNSISNSFAKPFSGTFSVPPTNFNEGANTLELSSSGNPIGIPDTSFVDTVTFWYPRRYLAENNRLAFFTTSQQVAKLDGFASQNIQVFDTTVADEPVLVTNLSPYQNGEAWGVDIPAGDPGLYFAVEDSGRLSADSITANNPAMWRVPSRAADLVIISHKDFLTEAETWANYRRGQGHMVEVVDVDEIFDEFSYGEFSSKAIERFLKYAVDNWQTAPGYVLLIGDATHDPRNYEGLAVQYNYVPTGIADTPFSETASDESLADFNDDGIADLAIGRIPARTGAHVTAMFNKTVAWEATVTGALNQRGVVFSYDVPNGYDFKGMSTRFRDQLPVTIPTVMSPRGDLPPPNQLTQAPGAHDLLMTNINQGPFLVNYSGHGATGTWASSAYFWTENVPQLTNPTPSIFMMLTCLNGFFHNTGNVSLAEVLTEAPNGGAVAAWASSGKTTPDGQEVMGQRFFNQLGAGDINRLGDLINDAKTVVPGGPEMRLSWVLIGDPMLQTQ